MASAPGIVIAAPASGAGKTLVTLGLLSALARTGRKVASAKVGPDYIDPRFHEAVTAQVSPNLDSWAMRGALLRTLALSAASDADIFIVEGVMGLFDGGAAGAGSTADIATALSLPVVLVVDAQAQAQSAAALVKGFAEFREDCRIAGIIFNRTGSAAHETILREAVAPLGVPVLGALRREQDIALPSRHLGLVQAQEHDALGQILERAGAIVESAVELDRLLDIAQVMPVMDDSPSSLPPLGQRIAVARDEAFAFAYPHLLDGWQGAGAEILLFSPLNDDPPDTRADAVYLPGGYPELHAGRLAGNEGFLEGLRKRAGEGALVYGECGGFMVLGDYLIDADGARHAMAGLLPLGTSFAQRKLHLGYRRLTHDGALPWTGCLRGHEFHYSTVHWQGDADPLFGTHDSYGKALGSAGLRRGRVMGSYAHVIDMESNGAAA